MQVIRTLIPTILKRSGVVQVIRTLIPTILKRSGVVQVIRTLIPTILKRSGVVQVIRTLIPTILKRSRAVQVVIHYNTQSIIYYPDNCKCIAMTPWVTPHSTGLATNYFMLIKVFSVLSMFLKPMVVLRTFLNFLLIIISLPSLKFHSLFSY